MERLDRQTRKPSEEDMARADDVLLQRLAEKKQREKEKQEALAAAAAQEESSSSSDDYDDTHFRPVSRWDSFCDVDEFDLEEEEAPEEIADIPERKSFDWASMDED